MVQMLNDELIYTWKDRLFVAILYTSDSDKIMKYTDEVRDRQTDVNISLMRLF